MKKYALFLSFFGLLTLLTALPQARAQEGSVKVTGEIVDTLCYVAMGAKGTGHRQCGLECAGKGIPVGLLEEGTGKLYVLLPSKDDTPVPQEAINKMGETATITGRAYSSGGSQFLTVESVS